MNGNDAKQETFPIKINSDLMELNEIGISIDNQLMRLRSSIRRIEEVPEEKAEAKSDLLKDPVSYDQMTVQERIAKLRYEYGLLLKKLCFLNQKLDERV